MPDVDFFKCGSVGWAASPIKSAVSGLEMKLFFALMKSHSPSNFGLLPLPSIIRKGLHYYPVGFKSWFRKECVDLGLKLLPSMDISKLHKNPIDIKSLNLMMPLVLWTKARTVFVCTKMERIGEIEDGRVYASIPWDFKKVRIDEQFLNPAFSNFQTTENLFTLALSAQLKSIEEQFLE